MNDFLARNSNIQPSRTAERAGKAVLETQASNQTGSRRDGDARAGQPDADLEQQLSTAAEVAEAQAKVAALLSELGMMQDAAAIDADALEAQIVGLMPRPMVIVPLPPANRDAVERAVQIAETIRASAVLALATQANVESGVVEGVLA